MSGLGDLLDYPPDQRVEVAESFLAAIRGKMCSNLEQSFNDEQGEKNGQQD